MSLQVSDYSLQGDTVSTPSLSPPCKGGEVDDIRTSSAQRIAIHHLPIRSVGKVRYNVGMRTDALWTTTRAAMLIGMACLWCALMWCVPAYAQSEIDAPQVEDVVQSDTTANDSEDPTQDTEQAEAAPLASTLVVTPVVANEKAKPRDIIKKELILTNNTSGRVNLYISVRNIDPQTGDQVATGPTESDLSTSLANWVEITRGVIELDPGESRKIPYLIHVNLTAKPGSYFARIAFHEGSSRSMAEGSDTNTELVLNLEVLDDAKERLQLGNFLADDSVVLGKEVNFSYLLENVGNRLIEPRGSIRIFNRKGEEVGSIPLNADGEEISPENKRQLAATWAAEGRFGKYKAFLDLEYGESQLASVQDTLYFWVFPWKEIMASLIGVLVLGILGTYIVHMRAMARPMPARAYRDEPTQAPAEPAYTPVPELRQHVATQDTAQGATVLLAKRQNNARSYSSAPAPSPTTEATAPRVGSFERRMTQGRASQTAVAPARAGVSLSGATVQLASRRRG